MAKIKARKKTYDEKQIEELVYSLRVCAQCSTCANCMFKPMKEEYEQRLGKSDFTCKSALMEAAAELICIFFP